MKKLLHKLKAFWKRKGFEPNPDADTIWAQAQTTSGKSNMDSANSTSVPSADDVIEALKKAKQEVLAFEEALKSLNQKATVV